MYEGRNKEFTREGTLPEPVLMTASSREFANVLGWHRHPHDWQLYD
jgi:hypothetical protein